MLWLVSFGKEGERIKDLRCAQMGYGAKAYCLVVCLLWNFGINGHFFS